MERQREGGGWWREGERERGGEMVEWLWTLNN